MRLPASGNANRGAKDEWGMDYPIYFNSFIYSLPTCAVRRDGRDWNARPDHLPHRRDGTQAPVPGTPLAAPLFPFWGGRSSALMRGHSVDRTSICATPPLRHHLPPLRPSPLRHQTGMVFSCFRCCPPLNFTDPDHRCCALRTGVSSASSSSRLSRGCWPTSRRKSCSSKSVPRLASICLWLNNSPYVWLSTA
jgi:hypothetical protein